MAPQKYDMLIRSALECGAANAALIGNEQVICSPSFREVCQGNQCGFYGRCWVCPPHIGPIEDCIAQIRQFPRGLLYQTIGTLEDSFDIEGMTAAARHHAAVSQKLHALLPNRLAGSFLHLSCGGCHLCAECTCGAGKPCRHPRQALSSLEGYGIDVYQTVRTTCLNYINGTNTVTYFGLVLFPE